MLRTRSRRDGAHPSTWVLVVAVAGALVITPTARAADGLIIVLHGIGVGHMATYVPSSAALERQVASLRTLGTRFVTVSQLLASLPSADAPLAAITFDDGAVSVHTEALPLLSALGVPATVFLITGRLGAPGSLDATMIADLLAAGWELGSHTASHAALIDLTAASVRRELTAARSALAALGADAGCLSYPFGLHDARVRSLATEVHACAVTSAPGRITSDCDPMALPRPAPSCFDADGLAWRADRGIDPVAISVSLAGVAAVVPAAATGTTAPPSDGWHPARWRTLGGGRYELTVGSSGLHEELALREGDWALQVARTRPFTAVGPGGAHAALARSLGRATIAAVWVEGEGAGIGVAVDVAAHGEVWAWWTEGGGVRVGGEGLLADGLRVRAAWHPAGRTASASLWIALPMWRDEGRPVSITVGYGRGAALETAPYARLAARIGAHELGLAVDTRGRLATGLSLRW